jgi:hypothetical protein
VSACPKTGNGAGMEILTHGVPFEGLIPGISLYRNRHRYHADAR